MSFHFCLRKYPELLRKTDMGGGREGEIKVYGFVLFYSEKNMHLETELQKNSRSEALSVLAAFC